MSKDKKAVSHDILSPADDHSAIIAEFRQNLSEDLSRYTDHDCLRFLRSCNGDIRKAHNKLERFHEWFHTLMDPISPLNGLHFSPNTLLYTPEHLANHPTGQGLLPVSHSGFDREGRPLYWEKTGAIQSNFSAVKMVFTREELLQFHIFSMIGLEMRYKFSTTIRGEPIESAIYISDMKGVTVSLDVDTIWYMKQLIATDLAYFPERLYRMVIINAPWYFPALYNMFKPFIDPRTREKIMILGDDYYDKLLEYMEPSQIPTDYGGEDSNIAWGSSRFTDDSGLSLAQMEQKMLENLETRNYVLTPQEMVSLHQTFSHPKYRDEEGMIRKRELLEAWMKDEGVELPSDEPNVEVPTATHTGQQSTASVSLRSVMQNQDAIFSMPQLQVCDVLTTSIVGIENRGNHHVYEISVNFKNTCSWTVKRRYSEFHSYMTKLKKVVPALSMEKCEMPPKVIFNKMSEKVVAYRSPALDSFLKATIENCKSYGTEEQNAIFTFLDAYDNIIRHVCSNDQEKAELIEAGKASVIANEGSVDSWQTPFAAAVITAWVIMISMGVDGLIA